MSHETCAACRAQVVPVRPSLGARAAFATLGLGMLAMLFGYPFIGFLWPFVIPVVLIGGMGLGPLVDAAFAPVTCPSCHRRFEAASSTTAATEAASSARHDGHDGHDGHDREGLPAGVATTILRAQRE
ncbi:MAG: hypothetical protein HYV09_35335 [Deltaproteobacteria bacterium]|nr:hypothetical protein [Deltaproteobacteria bacterium]